MSNSTGPSVEVKQDIAGGEVAAVKGAATRAAVQQSNAYCEVASAYQSWAGTLDEFRKKIDTLRAGIEEDLATAAQDMIDCDYGPCDEVVLGVMRDLVSLYDRINEFDGHLDEAKAAA